MARALILGSGAIGRGFAPWALPAFDIDFYDDAVDLVSGIRAQGAYSTYMSVDDKLVQRVVRPRHISSSMDDFGHLDYDLAIVSVGPRSVERLPQRLRELACPIFSLENDPITVEQIKHAYGLEDVYFGVPDVITSSAASPEHLRQDRFAIHTENGVLYLQDPGPSADHLKALLPEVHWLPLDRLNQEWDAKLYLHNMPHCIAAYLGHLAGATYLHESMYVPSVRRIVDGAIEEMLFALKMVTHYDQPFMESYAEKEIRRFSNTLLFDPISRVAREPLRKLQASGRLIGALRIMLSAGIRPTHLMLGIAGALMYAPDVDKDHEVMKLVERFGIPAFLQYHLSIPLDSMESHYIAEHFEAARRHLQMEIS